MTPTDRHDGVLHPPADADHPGDPGDPVEPAEPAEPAKRAASSGADQIPRWAFIAYVVLAAPAILFRYGAYHWFFRDDFIFLADRQGRFPDFLEPNGGAHWVAIPRAVYLVLWQVVGMRSYVPYQACVVALHLAVVVLLHVVMRRAGVNAWLAAAAASMLVLFGPGAENIVWAFQVGFTGSLAYGLVHLLLSDHHEGFGRRDVLGLAFGALAVMSSGVGITMAVVVGLAVLLRRGWLMALLHSAPLAALFGAWVLVADAQTSSPVGDRPSFSVLARWIYNTGLGTFLGLGHFPVLAAVLAGVLVVGLVLAWGPWRDADLTTIRQRHAAPVALFVGGIVFAISSGTGRYWLGMEAARSSRYLYLGAAFTLPLLAVAGQAIAKLGRPMTPVLVGLLLVPIPFNLGGFTPDVFGKPYMDQRKYVLTTAVRMPFADDVPRRVQPLPDPYASDAVTMGFLLTALRNGDLTPSSEPIRPFVTNEFKVRLGVVAGPAERYPPSCRIAAHPIGLSPAKGEVLVIDGPVRISTRTGKRRTGPMIDYQGGPVGNALTIELPDLDLLVAPGPGRTSFAVCRGR